MNLYFRLIRKFIVPHLFTLTLAIIFMILSVFFDSISLTALVPLSDKVLGQSKIVFNKELPAFLEKLIEQINNTNSQDLLNVIVFFIVIVFILKGICTFGRSYLVTKLSQLVIKDIRNALYKKIQNFSLDYFTQSVTGHLVSRITYDVDILNGTISVGLTMFYHFLLAVSFASIIFFINWKWALMSVLLVPLVAFPIVKIGKMIKKISTQAQNKMGDLNSKLFETISGVRIVKAFSMEDKEIIKVGNHTRAFYKIMMKLQRRALILGPFTQFIGA